MNTYKHSTTVKILVTGELDAIPAPIWENGQKTDRQREHDGHPVYRLRGALLLANGEAVADATVYTTTPPDSVPKNLHVGDVLTMSGILSIRAAKSWGLTASFIGTIVQDTEAEAFQLTEVV